MSLINQVLNDLEKRGTDVATGADAVRAVPKPAGRMWLLAAVLAALLLLAVAAPRLLQRQPAPPAAHQIARQPVVRPAEQAATPAPAGAEAVPALRLSFELSSIPLPLVGPARRHEAAAKEKAGGEKLPQPHNGKPSREAPAAESRGEYAGQPIKRISPQQQATDEYGQAQALIGQGRKSEALPHLQATLQLDPAHVEARLMLAGVLLESKRNAEAERVLQDGLHHDPKQPQLAMLLARLLVERGAMAEALQTLQTTLPFADQRADYHAFVAAVLQRQNRHKEAITHYQIALHLAPDSAVWWMGLGISLQAVDAGEDARDAFRHAADLHKLSPELQTFVEKQLKALGPPAK